MNTKEQNLMEYWQAKYPQENPVRLCFSHPYFLPESTKSLGKNDKDTRTTIAQRIWTGLPLTYLEYHFAIAIQLLVGDLPDYETFFMTRWHDSPDHCGYGSLDSCKTCNPQPQGLTP